MEPAQQTENIGTSEQKPSLQEVDITPQLTPEQIAAVTAKTPVDEFKALINQFNAEYRRFAEVALKEGAKSNALWHEIWTRGFAAYGHKVQNRAVVYTVRQGEHPSKLTQIMDAIKKANLTVSTIEFDPKAVVYRIYAN